MQRNLSQDSQNYGQSSNEESSSCNHPNQANATSRQPSQNIMMNNHEMPLLQADFQPNNNSQSNQISQIQHLSQIRQLEDNFHDIQPTDKSVHYNHDKNISEGAEQEMTRIKNKASQQIESYAPYSGIQIEINRDQQEKALKQLTVPHDMTDVVELRGPHLPQGSILLKKITIQHLNTCDCWTFFCCSCLFHCRRMLNKPLEEVHIHFGKQEVRDIYYYEKICQIPTLKILTINFGKELRDLRPSLSFSKLLNLQKLTLNYSNQHSLKADHIENLYCELEHLQNLEKFDFLLHNHKHSFTGIQFQSFAQKLSKLIKLQSLTLLIQGAGYVSEEAYKSAYSSLSQMSNLQELNINILSENLNPSINLLNNMENQLRSLSLQIDVQNNDQVITKEIKQFCMLSKFSIKCEDLRQVCQFIKWVSSSSNTLTDLEIYYHYVNQEEATQLANKVVDHLSMFPYISKFIMEDNSNSANKISPHHYEKIEPKIIYWKYLNEIYLSSSILDQFPDWYIQFTTIQFLYLNTDKLYHSKQTFESLTNGLKQLNELKEFAIEISTHCEGEKLDDTTLTNFFSSLENKQNLSYLKILNLCFMNAGDKAMMKFIDISTKQNLRYLNVYFKQLVNVTAQPFEYMLSNLAENYNIEFYKIGIEEGICLTNQNISELNQQIKKQVQHIPYFKLDLHYAKNVSHEINFKFDETQKKQKLFKRYIYMDELAIKQPFYTRGEFYEY